MRRIYFVADFCMLFYGYILCRGIRYEKNTYFKQVRALAIRTLYVYSMRPAEIPAGRIFVEKILQSDLLGSLPHEKIKKAMPFGIASFILAE